MSEFLHRYLEMGLSKIVSIDYSFHEENSGFQDEDTHETIVAHKGQQYVKISVHSRHTFGPSSGGFFNVDSEQKITPIDYRKLRGDCEIMDTPKALAKIQKEADEHQKYLDLEAELRAVTPSCPSCKLKFQKKHSKRTGYFWGCPRFPHCERTARITSDAQEILDKMKAHSMATAP